MYGGVAGEDGQPSPPMPILKSDFRLELVPQDADAAPYSLSGTLILSHGLASDWLRDVIDRLQNA